MLPCTPVKLHKSESIAIFQGIWTTWSLSRHAWISSNHRSAYADHWGSDGSACCPLGADPDIAQASSQGVKGGFEAGPQRGAGLSAWREPRKEASRHKAPTLWLGWSPDSACRKHGPHEPHAPSPSGRLGPPGNHAALFQLPGLYNFVPEFESCVLPSRMRSTYRNVATYSSSLRRNQGVFFTNFGSLLHR